MEKHTLWAWVVLNGIVIVCWAALAVFFGKWWIALFACLFLTCKIKTRTHMICDGCGRYSPYAETHAEAVEKELKAGWIRRKSGDKWEDYCPECQTKMK